MTAEDYFTQHVEKILTSVMQALNKDRARRFTHSEIAFFEMWWIRQNSAMKDLVRELVSEGRFEFANGGWVASDEACPTFTELLQNILYGHDFLKREFSITPKIVWHMDAFGHSSTTAKLFTDLGFEAFFFGRINDT